MEDLHNAIREAPSYWQLLQSRKKHLNEKDFKVVHDATIAEVWGKPPCDSFFAAMAWLYPHSQAVIEALKEDGITVHMDAEYERWFAEWCKTQGPPPATFPSNLNWYSQKREEFDALFQKEKQRWDLT